MNQETRDHIRQRLRDSRLWQSIEGELSALFAEKPPEINADEYHADVLELIAGELRNQFGSADDEQTTRQTTEADSKPGSTHSLDGMVRELSVSVEHALLSGNLQMVRALGEAIAQRDTGNSKHNPRVTLYSLRLGEAIGLGAKQVKALMKGALLHDIGKIGIRDAVLLKAGDLSEQERRTVNRHPDLGARIIGGVKWLEDALDVVRHHHERYDGTGYPDKLHGDAIPLNARIFMVVDVFDALTSSRPYKREFSYDESMNLIGERCDSHFDPEIVKAFVPISRLLYDELAWETYYRLDAKLQQAMATHFNLGTAIGG